MRTDINGMGRMDRLALRAATAGVRRADGDPRAGNRLDVVHLNEIRGGAAAAHLLEFDSVHGRWHASFGVEDDGAIRIDNKGLDFSASAHPSDVAWGDLGCDDAPVAPSNHQPALR
jgi:glyceraldehyde 3-phosphate dehydrogenase